MVTDDSSHPQTQRRVPSGEVVVRPATDADSNELIGLVAEVYAEYDNCILDVENEEPELLSPASSFSAKPGKFWVAEQSGQLVGSVALIRREGEAELKKLYVHRTTRRQGLASRLCSLAETQARQWGCGKLLAWSDSRFVEAHRFYERSGYVRQPESRELHDLSATTEYLFEKPLALTPPQAKTSPV